MGEGYQKKGHKAKKKKKKKSKGSDPIKKCWQETGAEGELLELKDQAQPTHETIFRPTASSL